MGVTVWLKYFDFHELGCAFQICLSGPAGPVVSGKTLLDRGGLTKRDRSNFNKEGQVKFFEAPK